MPDIAAPANARSRRTRQALLDATRAILEDQGFDALTVSAIAERAGVTRRAVYLHFDSIAAVIANLFDHIADAEGLRTSMERVWTAPDAVAALDAWAQHLATYHPRVMPVDRAVSRVEAVNADAAAHRAHVSSKQDETCQRLARWLADEDLLADAWTVETAADLLYGLIATDLIDRLLNHRGWSGEQLADGLSALLRSTLVRG